MYKKLYFLRIYGDQENGSDRFVFECFDTRGFTFSIIDDLCLEFFRVCYRFSIAAMFFALINALKLWLSFANLRSIYCFNQIFDELLFFFFR